MLAATTLAAAACGGGGSTPSGSSSQGSSGGGTANVPQLSAASFTNDFSAMAKLKPLVAQGKGKIAVILPDTVSSARYTEFDAPYLKESFQKAGLTSSQFSIQNAQGSDSTQLTDAQSAITSGATVLVVDPLDSGVGASIENYAKSHGVQVIDYDRLTLGGSRSYYVSFDNVEVGKLIGNGLVSCVDKWGVKSPNVIVMKGDPTDNNATLFAQGYDGVLAPKFKSGGWTEAATPAGTWDPPTAQTEFQQAYTAHKDVNAVLVPNDENAAPIITYLKTLHIKPQSFPVTGQDATLVGLQNILAGYQCGTAYKPIYLEAQATAALALYLRAGVTPPSALVNGTTKDTKAGVDVKSVLLKPEWVTTDNMASTVVADKFVPASQLCSGKYATYCSKYGIK
ncbi:MAG TPA: substrate-binding domain-containing protein [Nocardioidaceae bacterium]|nr:substrate-binding domain-containing protein [Nocardioidaceae bacterium]